MHPNNLAGLYESQGRYGEAELLHLQALQIRQAQLGEDHPSTASSLNNLAELYKSQGRHGEAEPLYLQALEIFRQILAENHPNTQMVLNNFVHLLRQAVDAGRTDELSDHPETQRILARLQA
jgi:tetratricopeptide (TPR) repeat protein